jgi:hypothetical protein
MATKTELSQRLLNWFKNVPNVTSTDTDFWTEEAMLAHGFSSSDDVPSDEATLILLYAQAEGARQIAVATAHYFSYTDGEESVDKSMISEQYRKLAKDLREEYERKKSEGAVSVYFMRRIDR